jgi:MAF protein
MTKLILASASPRRRSLIQLLGLPVRITTADVDEEQVTDPDPAINAVETARLKAVTVANTVTDDAIVIGADTIVALGQTILGKPVDAAEAISMLQQLRGRAHHVHTGIVLIRAQTGETVSDVATVAVPMRAYTDAEIEEYVATGDPMDKAGAYAIQHPGFAPVLSLSDCYAGVVGLPLCHLTRALRRMGVSVSADIATACQQATAYRCSVYQHYLT